jgi:hypothetical protein
VEKPRDVVAGYGEKNIYYPGKLTEAPSIPNGW